MGEVAPAVDLREALGVTEKIQSLRYLRSSVVKLFRHV
jgi:hypothetical protein